MLEKKTIAKWVSEGPDLGSLQEVEDFGRGLSDKKLSTSQIRQVFTRLKSIEAKGIKNNLAEFLMLKPYLAYAASRSNALGLQELKDGMLIGIDEVVGGEETLIKQRFVNFCSLFEAILAYHRAQGGK